MKTVEIANFVGGSPVEILGYVSNDNGPIVGLMQSAGSVRLHHAMRPEQARQMAAALIAAADDLEGAEVAERCEATA